MKKFNKILAGMLSASLAVAASAVMVSAEGEEDNSLTLETSAPVVEVTTEATTEAVTEPVTTIVTTASSGSPKTGQGAYALAAIPVGLLAAAAIVAKKKG